MIAVSNIFGRLGNQMFLGAYMIDQAKKGYIDDIYAQNPLYFEDSEEAIKELYRQGIPEMMNMVAIHVRRGDYVKNPFYIDLSETEYYQEAMALFPHSDFVVFSDDIEWCKEQPVFKDCEFFHGTELEDMNNMASCVGHIIANSSFSWWAAYIAPYTKKVVAPSVSNWFFDGIERTYCPNSWIRI